MEDFTRVTTILAPFSGVANIPEGILASAADRGTRVHQAIDADLRGLGLLGCDADIAGYVESYQRISGRIGQIYKQEERFNNEDLKVTGQIDLVADFDGETSLIDFKTSAKEGITWKYQLAAYEWLLNPFMRVANSCVIQLKKDGSEPEIFYYNNAYYLDIFFDCHRLYNIFFKGKEKPQWEMI